MWSVILFPISVVMIVFYFVPWIALTVVFGFFGEVGQDIADWLTRAVVFGPSILGALLGFAGLVLHKRNARVVALIGLILNALLWAAYNFLSFW